MIKCEHKFSEKFGQAEQKARESYLIDLKKRLEKLEESMFHNCVTIAGYFRGPGMKRDCHKMVKDMLLRFELARF